MTTVTLAKWGNSIGIRVPATILDEAHLHAGEKLEIEADANGHLLLKPLTDPRAGWLDALNAIADNGQDESFTDVPNTFDDDEWTW